MHFSRYGRRSALSGFSSFILIGIVILMELFIPGRRDYRRFETQPVPLVQPAAPQPETHHMAGAFYPNEHPEMQASPMSSGSTSVVPYISAALGGLAVFGLVGSGAFFVLGLLDGRREEEIVLE